MPSTGVDGPATDAEHAAAAEAARKPIEPVVALNLELPSHESYASRGAKGHARRVNTVEWHPVEAEEDEARVLVVDARGAAHFRAPTSAPADAADTEDSQASSEPTASMSATAGREFSCGTWDPHHSRLTVLGMGSALVQWDERAKKMDAVVQAAGSDGLALTSVSYNPNRPWYVCTGAEDGEARIWDLRAASSAASGASKGAAAGGAASAPRSSASSSSSQQPGLVLVLRGHAHAITQCKYNPCHDQLLATGSDDGTVNMWRASSVSSLPIYDDIVQEEEARLGAETGAGGDGEAGGGEDERRGTRMAPDALLKRSTGHGDTVS